ncbi:MAG TPA: gfo/Idh/MocA family oxidoreductase [Clostridiales bacterium]|nr:gfo/Idh/MocA family oxidoreductase [Clostridiales bacterium]
MSKLRIGIIGCGGIVRFAHMVSDKANPDVEVVALCDIIREKAEKMAAQHGIKDVYENYQDLLKREDIDAVDICTPNFLHSVIAVDAFRAGKHVFCEKPDAVSVEEVLKMNRAWKESGKVFMVMRNNRFRPDTRFLKKIIQEGGLGEIYAGRCGWIRRRGIPGKGGWFTTKAQSGGGPLIDLGVHMIDLAIWLMGNPRPVSVTGSTYCKFAGVPESSDSVHSQFGDAKSDGTFDVEDLAMGFIKFDNGASLAIEFSWASNIEKEDNFVELRGTRAGASVHSDGKGLQIFGETAGTLTLTTPSFPSGNAFQNAHAANLKHFTDVVLKGAAPIFEPEQGVNMIKILTAIYQSAETGREVQL